jgi:very-short-patch-repair endonuclease
MDQREIFAAMRKLYLEIDVAAYNPYPFDWVSIFTPIECAMWGSIRGYGGLPFYPQFPIGPYFADFADPIKKIVIECDGSKWHTDKARDAKRNKFMVGLGWKIFRLPGWACKKITMSPGELKEDIGEDWERDFSGLFYQGIKAWYLETSDGFISALGVRYYGHPEPRCLYEISDARFAYLIREAVDKWMVM